MGTFTVDGIDIRLLIMPLTVPLNMRENVSEVYGLFMDKIEKPEVNSKDVTIRINY